MRNSKFFSQYITPRFVLTIPKDNTNLFFSLYVISGALWYVASNASQHMTGNLQLLTDFKTIRPSRTIRTNKGEQLQVCGHGSVKTSRFSIPNVSYVPGLGDNIISISQVTDTGYTVEFAPDGFEIKKRYDGATVGCGSYGGNQLFHLDSLMIPE